MERGQRERSWRDVKERSLRGHGERSRREKTYLRHPSTTDVSSILPMNSNLIKFLSQYFEAFLNFPLQCGCIVLNTCSLLQLSVQD